MDNTKAQETMDAELVALAALVTASSRQMEMADRDRLSQGYSVAYGDCAAEGQDELSAMLRLREGIFNKPAPDIAIIGPDGTGCATGASAVPAPEVKP